ncbi:MAG: hypothetical protein H6668_06105 [Ardenticatenaceae bacterium]|nr:hypothetical protein [Ardenticatenaceae bacterium]
MPPKCNPWVAYQLEYNRQAATESRVELRMLAQVGEQAKSRCLISA